MKVGVAGAGAIGGVLGGLFYKNNYDVTLLVREKRLNKISNEGMEVKSDALGNFIIEKSNITSNINDLKKSDIILFCVKSSDTKEMAKKLSSILHKDTIVITFQNGVDNEEKLKFYFEEKKILSVSTHIQASMVNPNRIHQNGRVKLVIGNLHSESHFSAKEIVEVFQQLKVNAEYTNKILEKKWKKLVWNATFNTISSVAETSVGEILDSPFLSEIANKISEESIKVASGIGIEIEKREIFSNAELARNHKTSMLQDKKRGKVMEVESICGYIIKKGEELNICTPTLYTLYNFLNYMNEGLIK